MRTEIAAKDFAHNRVMVRTITGVEIVFGRERGIVRFVAKSPPRYVDKDLFNEARELAKKEFKTFREAKEAAAQK